MDTKGSLAVAIHRHCEAASLRALQYALSSLASPCDSILIIHVQPSLRSIPTPMGNHLPLSQASSNVVLRHMLFLQHHIAQFHASLEAKCIKYDVHPRFLLVETDEPLHTTLIHQIVQHHITHLVVGASCRNSVFRKRKPNTFDALIQAAPKDCLITLVSKNSKVTNKSFILPKSTQEFSNDHTLTNEGGSPNFGTLSLVYIDDDYYYYDFIH